MLYICHWFNHLWTQGIGQRHKHHAYVVTSTLPLTFYNRLAQLIASTNHYYASISAALATLHTAVQNIQLLHQSR